MKLAGFSPKASNVVSSDVMKVETELAKVSKTRVERRDPQGLYNKIDRPGLVKAAPAFAWDDYFKGIGFGDIRDVTVTSVPFFEGMSRLIKELKPGEWQNYLSWQVVHNAAPLLSKAFVDEN